LWRQPSDLASLRRNLTLTLASLPAVANRWRTPFWFVVWLVVAAFLLKLATG
jgi:hypothetical protein